MKKTTDPPLKRLGRGLGKFAARIGRFQSWLILTLFYFLIFAPFALVYKCFADPLHLAKTQRSLWHPKHEPKDLWNWARAQF